MELYDEVKEQRKSQAPMIIGISIAILVVITMIVIMAIIYLKSSITTIKIDGVRNVEIEKILKIESTEQGPQLYIPIIKMAKFLGYEGYNGDYKIKSEDKTKCHVISKDETAMFSLDSDTLVKITADAENEYIKLDQPVFEFNGELFTTIDGIQKAFNVRFNYDKTFKNINIYSMNFLLNTYATNLKLEKYSTDFTDQKAIFENMIIIQQNNQYGVLDIATKQPVLEMKYQDISYLPTTKEFLVKSNGKYGVVTKDASIVIKTVYDEIKSMDNQNGLYVVKQNGAYGVIDIKGNVIIDPDYKQIGINIDKYAQNGVDNKYVLLNEIIPIQNSEGLWAFFNIKGEKITDFKYNGIGCQTTTVSNSYPTLVIPSYKVIITQNERKYKLVATNGEELTPGVDAVYLKTNSQTGENKFFMTNNGKTLGVEDVLTSGQ